MDYNRFLERPIRLTSTIGEDQIYTVPSGATLRAVATDLQDKGIISNRDYLLWMAKFQTPQVVVKAGEYSLRSEMVPQELLTHLAGGDVVQYPLTLIEGMTFSEIRLRLAAREALEQQLPAMSDTEVRQALAVSYTSLEGLFYPETYHYSRGMSDLQLLRRAKQKMDAYLEQQWADKGESLPLKSPYEVLIMASIIEKETGNAAERPEISGVFNRRLQKGMKLQSDPTVIYGMGKAFHGNLRRVDLKRDTPYNTYTRHGLPPSPIALPGGDAIHAALHPLPGKSLYFVGKGDGTHHFSANLKEHNSAVYRYQIKRVRE
ncbi:MAG: endolytic transglycosylase MltG [Gammaproteobacteria bacterium]|nr:endolytic transglycosylase MltG [Gammaproteobacteria bacterium]